MSNAGSDPFGASTRFAQSSITQQSVTEALDRLFDLSVSDTGQAGRAANFLLAWWNASANGGFDLADLFGADRAVAAGMTTVFAYLSSRLAAIYPDQLGY